MCACRVETNIPTHLRARLRDQTRRCPQARQHHEKYSRSHRDLHQSLHKFSSSSLLLQRGLVTKREPRTESSKFLLCAPGAVRGSTKILNRLPHIIPRFFQLRRRSGIGITLEKNSRANAMPVQSLLERRAKYLALERVRTNVR